MIMKHSKRLLIVVAGVTLAGCSFFMPADKLKPRAAFDLHCPEDKLTMTELGGSCGKKLADDYNCTLGVSGCGQQVTYVHIPRGAWVMNNATKQASPPSP